ncbi:MAG TPA: PDZ domain-containing protein [Tepidisphaeraceae bacterium]|nr:PDZ domain-containing protein [Tepidisphaeraceae bacterium]
MIRKTALTVLCLLAATACVSSAAVTPEAAQKLYGDVSPSLVVVQYVFQNPLGRMELTGAGIIVSEDGMVAASLALFPLQFPDDEMKEFKILVPRKNGEPTELEAVFQGRDERTNLAFLKTKEPQHWKPIKFEEATVKVGDPILSVGMLPKGANFKTYFVEGAVSALLRGEVPQVLVTGGGLAAMGSPVFDTEGKAIGIVSPGGGSPLLNDTRGELQMVQNPPRFYVPTRDFQIGISDPPTAGKPLPLPWMGVSQMTGVTKDLADVLGLGEQPAIQVGDVVPNAPAEKAGIKPGDIIVKFNGKPLERGDQPAELPAIMGHQVRRMKPGDKVTVSILREKDQAPKDIELTLGEQPKGANLAKRYFADDLGFEARELVFNDIYSQKLPLDQKGVIVSLMRPQGAAQNGQLHREDVITKIDNEAVTDIDQFKKTYEQIRKERPKEAIVLEVHRGSGSATVRIEPPQ